jgi:trk system potassium uptake protein
MPDIRPVAHIIGWLVFALGLLMLLPMGIDLIDRDSDAGAFALAAVVTILTGTSVVLACTRAGSATLDLRQGFLLTTGAWTVFPAFGALPMMLGAPGLDLADAYFEAMSAMTTTGGTVIVGLNHMPRGTLLWRGLLQWVGGIGIILMAMILLPVLNSGGMQLLRSADFNTLGKIMPRTKDITLSIGRVYIGLSVACALAYLWCGMKPFDAVVHAMTTMSSGGMGNYDASFAPFSPAAQYVSTVFMLLAAISFARFVQALAGQPGALLRDSQIRTFLYVYGGFVAAILVARLLGPGPVGEEAFRETAFNVASLISSTGYASTDYTAWGGLSVMLVFCTMMVGGCSGSTAGGVKIFRYELLFAAVSAEVKRLYSPNVVILTRYQSRTVSADVLDSVTAFFMFYFLSLGTLTVALVLLGLDPITAISGVATCLANVGPGLGPQIGPAGNFAGLSDAVKWVLSATMLIGRLEVMSVFVLFTAAFWRG